jgi:di/tricarboxylate transporter
VAGAIYLVFASGRLAKTACREPAAGVDFETAVHSGSVEAAGGQIGSGEVFAERRALSLWRAVTSVGIFAGVVLIAALGWAPIAATALAGAVLLILLRVISADEAYGGMRPQVLLLIAGMIVLGVAMEESGLAGAATDALVGSMRSLGPLVALAVLYGATLFLTEILSNATVAVLVTPIAVALAESLGVSARPFLIAVMMAGSAAFATPFGYQTNVLVYQMGGYAYMDFVRIGLPLNLVTWVTGVAAISYFFPF